METSRPWVIVAPGFHQGGGMERANLSLAEYLLERGSPVHLVGYRIDAGLAARRGAVAHEVRRPAGSYLLGERLVDRRGQAVARKAGGLARVVVNGGNCGWEDINWVHFVHHAWTPVHPGAPLWFQAKARLLSRMARADERARIPRARVVIANSDATRNQLIELLGVDPDRVRTIYLGSDPTWGPATSDERAEARSWLKIAEDRPLVVFVGALGYDARKGFDILLASWAALRAQESWDAELVVAGGGRGMKRWVAEARRLGIEDRVRFLGFTNRVPALLAAADLLVSPVRYEPYGLNVQEALCRGVPAIVSERAGIAERYPVDLRDLVLRDPDDAAELAERLLRWRGEIGEWRVRIQPFSSGLRARSWRATAADIVSFSEGEVPPVKKLDSTLGSVE